MRIDWEEMMRDLNMSKKELSRAIGYTEGYINTKVHDRNKRGKSGVWQETRVRINTLLKPINMTLDDYIVTLIDETPTVEKVDWQEVVQREQRLKMRAEEENADLKLKIQVLRKLKDNPEWLYK